MLLDDTLDLLSDKRRRNVLYIMDDADEETFTYDDITEKLIENDLIRKNEENRFKIQMAHSHLPRIEDSGIIEHDKRSETIRYTRDEDIEELLEVLQK